jgi:hypothetical protein
MRSGSGRHWFLNIGVLGAFVPGIRRLKIFSATQGESRAFRAIRAIRIQKLIYLK